jgi:hypothetical protein
MQTDSKEKRPLTTSPKEKRQNICKQTFGILSLHTDIATNSTSIQHLTQTGSFYISVYSYTPLDISPLWYI